MAILKCNGRRKQTERYQLWLISLKDLMLQSISPKQKIRLKSVLDFMNSRHYG